MKNRIREIAIICIVGCIVASMLSSCQRHEKRIFFDVAVSGGILSELDSWKTDEELFKILPLKSEIFVEEDAPSETEIDFVCQEMHSGNKFYYEESLKYCGYSVRSYKYRTPEMDCNLKRKRILYDKIRPEQLCSQYSLRVISDL